MKSGRHNEVQQLYLHYLLFANAKPDMISFLLLARPLDLYRSWSATEKHSQLCFCVLYAAVFLFACLFKKTSLKAERQNLIKLARFKWLRYNARFLVKLLQRSSRLHFVWFHFVAPALKHWGCEVMCRGGKGGGGSPVPHSTLSLSPLNPLLEPAARCQWFLSQRTFEMPPVSRLRQFKVWHANDIYSQRLSAGDGNQLLVMPADCLNTWADRAPLRLRLHLPISAEKKLNVVFLSAATRFPLGCGNIFHRCFWEGGRLNLVHWETAFMWQLTWLANLLVWVKCWRLSCARVKFCSDGKIQGQRKKVSSSHVYVSYIMFKNIF